MERLEAALEKARASRRQALTDAPITAAISGAPPKVAVRTADNAGDVAARWHNLKEIKVTTHTARRNRISTLFGPSASGAHDVLRSRVLRLMQENKWKTLAVTSPNPGCGKTTVCANLGFSLARQLDLKVMVLDLDLRRPSLHDVLGHKPKSSFYEVLEGKVRAEDQLVRAGENLIFGLNARSASRPAELLQAKLTHDRLAMIKDAFRPDITIFDLPPMLVSDDNIGFLPKVDCGMLVNAAESTTIQQLDNCEKELSELTNVLGVVLNKCRHHDGDSAGYGEYY